MLMRVPDKAGRRPPRTLNGKIDEPEYISLHVLSHEQPADLAPAGFAQITL
jgi:hypothetical protein